VLAGGAASAALVHRIVIRVRSDFRARIMADPFIWLSPSSDWENARIASSPQPDDMNPGMADASGW